MAGAWPRGHRFGDHGFAGYHSATGARIYYLSIRLEKLVRQARVEASFLI